MTHHCTQFVTIHSVAKYELSFTYILLDDPSNTTLQLLADLVFYASGRLPTTFLVASYKMQGRRKMYSFFSIYREKVKIFEVQILLHTL